MDTDEVHPGGVTLIVGPTQAGKTRMTARALAGWLEEHGADGVVVLDFGPEVPTEDGVIGGRLTQFIELPADVWYGEIEARGPRSEGATPEEVVGIAAENADRARALVDRAPPTPQAVFVNDATIAFQHDPADVDRLVDYCQEAASVVVNAFEGAEFGQTDPVSRTEQQALIRLRGWADRIVDLGGEG